jgi:DNA repair photolyase
MIGEFIRQDETWLTIDPVIGCTMNCKYCFLQSYGETPKPGKEFLSVDQVYNLLINSNYYTKSKIIMIGSETDYFMHKRNINYLKSFLTYCKMQNLPNTIAVVTKNEVDADFLD